MTRKTKNFLTHIAQSLKLELGDSSLTSIYIKHAVALICQREDTKRIKTLARYFRIRKNSDDIDPKQFYFWIKEYPITVEDEIVYEVFDAVGEELGVRQADPTHFSVCGGELLKRIVDWKEGAGNKNVDILSEYFEVALKTVLKFNKTIATSPKSLLGSYGWGLFEEHIDSKYGGKFNYLKPSEQEIQENTKDRKILVEIQSIKDKLLKKGFLEDYDNIGKLLSFKSIDEVHKILIK